MVDEISCGAVLFCKEDNIRKYVLVMEANGSYGFPKGHKEGNESDLETAQREILEETGIHASFLPNLKRTIQYRFGTKEKQVTFFVAKFDHQELKILDKSILAVKKLPFEAAIETLKFQELKNILLEIHYMLDLRGE